MISALKLKNENNICCTFDAIFQFLLIIMIQLYKWYRNNGYDMTWSETVSCSKKWVQKIEPHSCMIEFHCPTGGLI